MKRQALVAVAAATALVLTGCASGSDTGSKDSTELNVYAWAGEVPDSMVKMFEEETGIKVTVDTFDSNETMISKLAAGGSGYDVVEPSQYAVQLAVGQNLLAEIDYDKIEGMDNLMDKFRDPSFDPGNKYSIPWVWGTTGLMYNSTCTGGEEITSWSSMFDEKYKGKIYMLDNMLAAYIAGLQINGFSANSLDEAEVAKATESLIEQKKLLAGYNSTNYDELVVSGDACIAEAWGGSSVAEAVATHDDVHYVLPKEGGTLWVDNFAIVADAPHTDAAYKWMNFMLRPEVAAIATNEDYMSTANVAANDLITDKTMLDNPAVFAPEDQLEKSEFIVDPGEAMRFYQDGWTRVKAS
ncbi:PotD/PotF family extracellular solute-binding protein [Homoserinimonas sp. OAct 916]|uniref:ABC transporter substrate-binding protein n=1 Tax=Homoserinimonas sp. OAct 916 TaxID=2211450 RepID=UPI000DBE7BEF|nr:spermidine/putrescine ABC transporter substrate-binding protein [Homoserinimonas sp. OAct 916]